jgi:hypothetical protein
MLVTPGGMNAKDLIVWSKQLDLRYCAGGFYESLRYMDAYRQGATGWAAGGVCQQEVHQQPLRYLPASNRGWLNECMAGYEAMFGEKIQESMLDMDAVVADVVGRSGLGRDVESEDEDSDASADEEGASDAVPQEPGGAARGVKATDDDSKEVDDDAFASSREESETVEEVAAARVDRSMGRALCQIAVLEASAITAPARAGGVNAQGRPQRMRAQVTYLEEVQAQRWTS